MLISSLQQTPQTLSWALAGGVIMMGKDFPNPWGKKTPKGEIKMMSQLLDSAVFPGIQGGPLEHVIAAKAVAFGECLQPEYKRQHKVKECVTLRFD